MTDIDISRRLEEEEKREQQAPEEAPREVKEEEKPKDVRNILIFLGVVAGLFVLVLGGFTAYDKWSGAAVVDIDTLHQQNLEQELGEDEGYVYNGYSFVKADGLWWTELNKFGTRLKIPLHFSPREVESIAFSGELDEAFNNEENISIAIDPDVANKYYTLALSELSFNLVKGMDRVPVGSCTTENWACENRTIISCENNPLNKPVIELALSNETNGITIEGTCIKISGSEYGIVKATDRLLYKWYGIME